MKRAMKIVAALALVCMVNACSNSQKSCAAYAKHDTEHTKTLDDVQ